MSQKTLEPTTSPKQGDLLAKQLITPTETIPFQIPETEVQPPSAPPTIVKGYRFVHNSPNSIVKSKARMKPAFRVVSQDSNTHSKQQSVIIEQTFNQTSGNVSNDRQYVFQLNAKRPPGRPRKNPIEAPKVKRPQGRPRKYPTEITNSSNGSELKKDSFMDGDLIEVRKGRGRPKRTDKDPNIDPLVQLQQPSELELAVAVAAQQPIDNKLSEKGGN